MSRIWGGGWPTSGMSRIWGGGWPGLSVFPLPVPEQWVPRPCVLCKGGYDAACTMGLFMPSGLHRTYGAHQLHFIYDEEARGEAEVYASQSREARLGRRTGGVAVEQLSFLSSGRSQAGQAERRLDEDFVPESGGVASQLQAFVVPALRKVREGRGTHCAGGGRKVKPGRLAPSLDVPQRLAQRY